MRGKYGNTCNADIQELAALQWNGFVAFFVNSDKYEGECKVMSQYLWWNQNSLRHFFVSHGYGKIISLYKFTFKEL